LVVVVAAAAAAAVSWLFRLVFLEEAVLEEVIRRRG
jgi:hypothetical protein